LSAWGASYSPPEDVAVDATVDLTATPFDQVRLMDGPTFFSRLATALKDNPPYQTDAPMIKKLRKLGVRPRGEPRQGKDR
jgi:hypothetical protein